MVDFGGTSWEEWKESLERHIVEEDRCEIRVEWFGIFEEPVRHECVVFPLNIALLMSLRDTLNTGPRSDRKSYL